MKQEKFSAFEMFQNERDEVEWKFISGLEEVCWDENFIAKHADKLDWNELSLINDLPWSIELIKQHENRWNWHNLSSIIADKEHFDNDDFEKLLELYENKLDWGVICSGTNLHIFHFEKYANHIDWNAISGNGEFCWHPLFLSKNADRINWKAFSESLCTLDTPKIGNKIFRKSALHTLADYLDWSEISENVKIKFTQEILNDFKDRWDWEKIINNSAITWTLSMVREYDEYLSTIDTKALHESYMWNAVIDCCVVEKIRNDRF